MDCNFEIRVSMLMDGELSNEESEEVKNHLANCSECQKMQKDFLFFRQQIKEPIEAKNFEFIEKNIPFWRKGIAVPTPVFVGLLMVLIGLGIWVFIPKSEPTAKDNQTLNSPNSDSLAKYDKGGRAEIYVVQKDSK